jgi:predicted dehydrogenase
MTKALKLGFIGGGINSAVGTTHVIAAKMDGRFKVEAGCFSRHDDINIQTASKLDILPDRRYRDAIEFLEHEKGRLDAVVILTPTPNHVEHVIHALQQGYPVICEKALASTSVDALLIKQAKIDYHGFIAVTYNYTGYPMLRELKHMISHGRLGRVEQIHIEMPQDGFARLNQDDQPLVPQEWRLHDGKVPTISLDLGVHLHHIIDFLTGEKPCEVSALQSRQGHFRQIVDNTMCIARYTNGLDCNIWFSKAALGYRNGLRVRVFGDRASAEWYQMEPELMVYHDNMGRKSIIDRASVDVEVANQLRYNRFKSGHPAGFLEAFANHYWDIAESLSDYKVSGMQSETDYSFSTQHALEGLVMLEAMAKSANNQSWEPVIMPI